MDFPVWWAANFNVIIFFANNLLATLVKVKLDLVRLR